MVLLNRVAPVLIAALLVTSFAVTALAPTHAMPGNGGGPNCLPREVLENDDVRIWFQGLKGHLKVFDKEDNDTTLVYDYQTVAVREVTDDNQTVANFKMDRAFPHDSTCTVEEDENFVNITFTITKEVKAGTSQGTSVGGSATVDVLWHWNKSAEGVKFDLFVHDWPWQSNATELAFDFNVVSDHTIESAENGLGFRNETGDSKGYIEWAPNATAHYADHHTEESIVASETAVSNGNNTADVSLRFTNVTAGYTMLEYDPWVGVGDYIIVLGVLIPLGPIEALLPPPARGVVQNIL